MAKAVSARRQGDEYQALFFWNQLVNILIDENINAVTFESDKRIFVDDIVVEYSENLLDSFTRQEYRIQAYQCKYHVSQNTTFTIENFIDPEFINNEQSMLHRLYDAYRQYCEMGVPFLLHIVSSSGWDAKDDFSRFLSTEGHIRSAFFEKGPRSIQGRIRSRFSEVLGVSGVDLEKFLRVVRFNLGLNRKLLIDSLNTKFDKAGLIAFDKKVTSSPYYDLAWKWYEQGINSFDKPRLQELTLKEKLIDLSRKELLVIRHQSLDPIMPDAVSRELLSNFGRKQLYEFLLDFTNLYRDGKLISPITVLKEQNQKTREIINLYKSNPNLEIVYHGIAHVPLVFLLGFQMNNRKSIHLLEHNSDDSWSLLGDIKDYPILDVKKVYWRENENSADVVIKFGVSYKIFDNDIKNIVSSPALILDLSVENPVRGVVRSRAQIEEYAKAFRDVLDEIHNSGMNVRYVHLFYAGPVSLAIRCGQQISPTIHPKVVVYNYSNHDEPKYKWGVCLNAPVDSPEFLVQF